MPKIWMKGVGSLCVKAHYRASLFLLQCQMQQKKLKIEEDTKQACCCFLNTVRSAVFQIIILFKQNQLFTFDNSFFP